jgi:hypothetical protein
VDNFVEHLPKTRTKGESKRQRTDRINFDHIMKYIKINNLEKVAWDQAASSHGGHRTSTQVANWGFFHP